MSTSSAISTIKTLQAAFSVLSTLNLTEPYYPQDAKVSNCYSYDYIVVGGGTPGTVVATRLVEAGYSVLVIEGGGLPGLESILPGYVTFLKNSRTDYNYTVEGRNPAGCRKSNEFPVSKGIGGVGTTDIMVYNRGDPPNYENWSEDGAWSWENMMKYFKKSESLQDPTILNSPYRQYHGINGKINITRESDDVCDKYIKGFKLAGQPTPLDNIGNASVGYSRALYFVYNGLRTGASSYIVPIKDNPKIHLSLFSSVVKIIFDSNKNAVGVQFIKNGKKITAKAKKEVILCAGPIRSPQLLMLSGIGPKKQLKQFNIPVLADLPVGQNLQNVIGALLVFKTNKKAKPKPYNAFRTPTPLVIGYAAPDEVNIYGKYEAIGNIIDDYDYFLAFCGFTLDFDNKICDDLYRQGKNTQLLVTTLNNLLPKSLGQILLNSANPEDQPKIITGDYSNKEDLDAIVEKIQHYVKVLSTPYFKDMGLEFIDASKCSQYKKGTKEFWKCYALCMIVGSYRQVGSNSMGAVVDSKLRVKGVKKLRIVDTSVIPNTINGSIAAVVIAIAEKAAELIISYAKSMLTRNGFKIKIYIYFSITVSFYYKSLTSFIYNLVLQYWIR